jgi:hypothetical protein
MTITSWLFICKKKSASVFKKGSIKAFFWDYDNLNPYKVKKIHGSVCGAGFNYKGTFGVFTSGISLDRTNNTRSVNLNLFNNVNFEVVSSIKETTVPIHGGVDVVGNTIYANIDGKIYQYGNPYPGLDVGMHQICKGSGTGTGMLKYFFTGRMLASTYSVSGETASGGLQILSENFAEQAIFDAVYAELLLGKRQKMRITDILVEFMTKHQAVEVLPYNYIIETETF